MQADKLPSRCWVRRCTNRPAAYSPSIRHATHLQLVVLLVLQARHEVGVALPRRPHRLSNGHRPLPSPVAHLVQLRLHLGHAAWVRGGGGRGLST